MKARLALRALRLLLSGSRADPTPDYDVASTDYDAFFSRVMGRHSLRMLESVDIRPGGDVIELACGTGHISAEVARRLDGKGSIRAVDISEGMLAVARDKLAVHTELDVTLERGDMLTFLRAQPDASADVVICGWAICYTRPPRLFAEMARVLRPGGQVAVIETRADALSAMTHVLERVFAADPSLMTGLIRVALPSNEDQLRRWLLKAGLVPLSLAEGGEEIPCRTPEEALEWVERSGAAAGFRDAVDQDRADEVRERLRAELARYIADHGALGLRHTFVVGIARSQEAALAVGSARRA